jgi:phosphoethanolamine N-methyltransferase
MSDEKSSTSEDPKNPERQEMRAFWEGHSKHATLEYMLLDEKAVELTLPDREEVLSLVPDFQGQRVLELAAGIGRFTGTIADKAGHLEVVEFMENFMKANEKVNGHRKNVSFVQKDATTLEYNEESFDLIFSCWMLMYFTDAEVRSFALNALKWLEVGGHLFFRESCFCKCGNVKMNSNPSQYREPLFYFSTFSSISLPAPNGGRYRFELVRSKNIETYVTIKGNKGQISWLWQKVWTGNGHGESFQEFLDSHQYTLNGILRYERIFGHGYISTGGPVTTEEFVSQLNLKPGHKVLDIGCGIGGGDFYIAEKYGAEVHGIDLSVNMISIALERAMTVPDNVKVHFDICDATCVDFPANSFDVVYSRDTILHIKDKLALFKRLHRWLRPGGTLMISDYCCKSGPWSDRFTSYVKQRRSTLLSVEDYGKTLKEAGFADVNAQDRTEQFTAILKEELDRFTKEKGNFLQDFSEEDYTSVVSTWESKLVQCREGDQRWGLFIARKA